MAHHTETVGYPPLPLNGTMRVRIRALSPTADSEVAGVTCTLWALYGRDMSDLGLELEDVIPLLTPQSGGA